MSRAMFPMVSSRYINTGRMTGQCEDLICGLAGTRIRGRMYKLLPGRLSRRVNTKEIRGGDGEVRVDVGRREGRKGGMKTKMK